MGFWYLMLFSVPYVNISLHFQKTPRLPRGLPSGLTESLQALRAMR